MAGISGSTSGGVTALSDAHLIRIIQTFFELNDWTISCNDMLTKVFHALSASITRGCFEDTLRGFMSYLRDNGSKKYRRDSKDMTYFDFQVMIAGLIMRFANSRTLKEVMDNNQDAIPSNCSTMIYNVQLNSNMLSIIDPSPYAGIRLTLNDRPVVINPKQGTLLVYLFTKYYSHNSIIENSAVCNIMETLEQIDEAMFGSVEVTSRAANYESHSGNSSLKDSAMSVFGGKDVVVDKYIKGQYHDIFSTLNYCLLQYDFLNTEPSHPNKKLLEYYVAAIMGLSTKPEEFLIWSFEVTNVGEVTRIPELVTDMVDTNIDHEKAAFIILTSLMLAEPQSIKKEMSYKLQYFTKKDEVNELLAQGLYSDKNPYDVTVTRNKDRSVSSRKLELLKSLNSRLIPSVK